MSWYPDFYHLPPSPYHIQPRQVRQPVKPAQTRPGRESGSAQIPLLWTREVPSVPSEPTPMSSRQENPDLSPLQGQYEVVGEVADATI